MKERTYPTSSSLLLTLSELLENTVKTVDTPTFPAAASTLMLSLSEFALLMSEQQYHFLSQSLNNLEQQVERHRSEKHAMELNIMNFKFHQQQSTRRQSTRRQINSPSISIPPPSSLPTVHIQHHQHHRRSFNGWIPPYQVTGTGSMEDPIYIFDDDEIRCEGCSEEGHFIGDCTREYRFDGRRYVPIPEGENPMEPTYVVDKDYYRQEGSRF